MNVTYGCTAAEFQTALNKFDGFSPYVTTVTRTIYDSSNNTLSNTTGAARIDYVASMYLKRSAKHLSESFQTTKYGYDGTFTQTPTTTHSDLLNGTFTLSIGGVDIKINNNTNIAYDVSASSLQTAIRTSGVVGFNWVEVTRVSTYGCGYSCTWVIKYRDYNNAVPAPVLNGLSLTGGSASPSISAATYRPFSQNIEFDPIDYRFLNTYSASINVLVKTNNIPAVCTGTCAYAFKTYSEIDTLSNTGATLTLGVTDPTSAGFALADISVTVGGLACTGLTGTVASFTCTMTKNTDNTPILVAGDVTPVVYIKNYGIVGLQTGTGPLSVPLAATSLSVTTGGDNGGYLIKLVGTGFPTDKSKMSLTLCSKNATIESITNI